VARRCFPSLADDCRLPVDRRLKVGGWLEAEAIELQRKAAQPDRYSERKLEAALEVKLELRDAVRTLCKRKGRQVREAAWSEVRKDLQRAHADLQHQGEGAEHVEMLTQPPTAGGVKLAPPATRRVSRASSSSSVPESAASRDASVESTSSSTPSASSQDEDEALWIHGSAMGGRLHLVGKSYTLEADDDGGRHRFSACGRRLRDPALGEGLASAPGDRAWSPRCWGKLAERQRAWWVEHRGA